MPADRFTPGHVTVPRYARISVAVAVVEGCSVSSNAESPGPLISIVVPILNEESQLGRLVDEIEQACSSSEPIRLQVILCDDGSTDSSWAEILRLSVDRPFVEGLALSRNFGKDQAVFAGLAASEGQAVIVMDGDGQHPPDLIPDLLAAWHSGAELVEAVKTGRPGQSWLVRLAARSFNRSFSTLTGVDLTNATDFRLLSRPMVDELLAMPERSVFFRGMSAWLGYRRAVVEFEPRSRDGGETRWTLWTLTRFAVRNLVSFTSAPLHIVTAIGGLFALFAALLALHTLYVWFTDSAVEGFTTVILLLLVQGSVVMVALGVIGLYVSEIHKEVKRRPRYVIARRTKDLR